MPNTESQKAATEKLGRVAFEAYNERRGGKNHEGKPTPPWAELPEEIREAWAEAATAAVEKAGRMLMTAAEATFEHFGIEK